MEGPRIKMAPDVEDVGKLANIER